MGEATMNIEINNIVNKVNSSENLKTFLLLITVAVISIYYILSGVESRNLPRSNEAMENISKKIKARQDALNEKIPLPLLWKSWEVIEYISQAYDVKILPMKKSLIAEQINSKTWNGEIIGSTFDVIFISMYLQKRIPIKYGHIKAGRGAAVLSFSLLGV